MVALVVEDVLRTIDAAVKAEVPVEEAINPQATMTCLTVTDDSARTNGVSC